MHQDPVKGVGALEGGREENWTDVNWGRYVYVNDSFTNSVLAPKTFFLFDFPLNETME